MNPTSNILNELQAETVLEGSHVLEQITTLRTGLRYSTDGQQVSFNDFYDVMQKEIGDLTRLKLEETVTPGTEAQYQIQLVTALEKIFDDADRVLNRLLFFQSKLRAAKQQSDVLEVTFIAWYSLAVSEALENYKAIKLSATVIKALAQAEFGRLMEGVHIDLETLLEATKILAKQIQSHKSLAQEKYNLGKDQVNASWTSQNIPAEGLADSDGASALINTPEPEEEDTTSVPAFVTTEPRLGSGKFINSIETSSEPLVRETTRITLESRLDHKGTPWTRCDMCHDLMCPWCYPQKNWPEYKEPTRVAIIGDSASTLVAAVLSSKLTLPRVEIPEPEPPPVPTVPDWKEFVVADNVTPVSADDLSNMLGDSATVEDITITATNAEGKSIPVVKERKHKTALHFEEPGNHPVITRAKDSGQPEKIHCLVCSHRIRAGQTMFERDGGWAHAFNGDCLDVKKIEAVTEAMKPVVLKTVTVPTIPNDELFVLPANILPLEEAAVSAARVADGPVQPQEEIKGTFKKFGDPAPVTEIKGTFKKFGDPAPVTEMVPSDAATILEALEQTATAVAATPRKKLQILPEGDEIV